MSNFKLMRSVGQSWGMPYRCNKDSMQRLASEYSSIPEVVNLFKDNKTIVSILSKEELDILYNKKLSDYDIASLAIKEMIKDKGVSTRDKLYEDHIKTAIYTCKKDSQVEKGDHVIEITENDISASEAIKKLKESLDKDNLEIRSPLTKKVLNATDKVGGNFLHAFVDLVSRQSKHSIRYGIRPKYLNIETGNRMPSQMEFDEFFSMFTLISSKSFDPETHAMPFTSKEISQSCKLLQLPHLRGYLTYNRYVVSPNNSIEQIYSFLESHKDFIKFIDDDLELPKSLIVCIALLNAVHVKGYLALRSVLKFIGEDIEDSNSGKKETMTVVGEFIETCTTKFRTKYLSKEGVGSAEAYMQLLKILPIACDTPTLLTIQRMMEEGE